MSTNIRFPLIAYFFKRVNYTDFVALYLYILSSIQIYRKLALTRKLPLVTMIGTESLYDWRHVTRHNFILGTSIGLYGTLFLFILLSRSLSLCLSLSLPCYFSPSVYISLALVIFLCRVAPFSWNSSETIENQRNEKKSTVLICSGPFEAISSDVCRKSHWSVALCIFDHLFLYEFFCSGHQNQTISPHSTRKYLFWYIHTLQAPVQLSRHLATNWICKK